jgi:diadenosine tetraphosphate (Ap4A) HIT family hydrolase/PII-like signaling protein
MNDCPFCDAADAVLGNALAYARFDRYPVNPGHLLLLTRRHVATYFEATGDERAAIFELVDAGKRLLDERFRPNGYNIGINVGAAAGQTIAHLHVHLIPRYTGDTADPRGGVRGVIPSQQQYPTAAPAAGGGPKTGATQAPTSTEHAMQGSYLRFYVVEGQRLHGTLLWEWLLRTANKMGIRGGSAFHAMAGFGRHHRLHEDRFFELAGNLIVEVEFIVTADERQKLLDLIAAEKVRLFYAEIPARFGVLNPDRDDPPMQESQS